MPIPSEVQSALAIFDIIDMKQPLVRDIQLRGPQVTANLEATRDFLSRHTHESLNERQVAAALLFMVLSPARQKYSPALFVSAINEGIERRFDWPVVVQEFDFNGLQVSTEQFLMLFHALLPIAQQDHHFDMQKLWGGRWRHPLTQLSFLRSFLSLSPPELDATNIPRLRQAYDPGESSDGPEAVTRHVERAQRDPTISVDAIIALVSLLVPPDDLPSQDEEALLAEVINDKEDLFLCSCTGIQKPWSAGQQNIMKNLLRTFLHKSPTSYYVLHTLWKQDKQWVAMKLIEMHSEDPLELITILDQAREHGWMEDLCTLTNGFGIDLAALAHRKGYLDFEQWADDKLSQEPHALVIAISKFLDLKAQDELRTARDEQPAPRTVSLAMKTVYDMLAILDQHMADRLELKGRQRQCLQAFPRLIIYCEGTEENVDVDCKESNRLPRSADAAMQELYKRMYSSELKVEDILEDLRECKTSQDPARVDLFACMIHGLFDEFSCFSEYPLVPLATTAVLFGGIMSVGLISNLTLRVGQQMVLDSVRDYGPDDSMFKFGLQALLHVVDRLREPEWTDYCERLVEIPGIQRTEPYRKALEALAGNSLQTDQDELNGENGLPDGIGLPNGVLDDHISPDTTVHFNSIHAEPSLGDEEPNEETEERVVFFFNNISKQNLNSRLNQLQDALGESFNGWFANFLVERRAKVEPNNQSLYLEILQLLSNKVLWNEVLRETYVSVQKLLNAETTMQSASERKNLKNLAVWLGSLTIARDKPIKFKNVSFVDLLMEGLDTSRLVLVIPFTCNVLAQGIRSVVFKPPNPWLMEIMAVLMELYFYFDIKLNHKFEIEVLCKEFGLTIESVPPSAYLRSRPIDDDLSNNMMPDGLDGFEDMALASINRNVRNPRFDADNMSSTLPDLESLLVFPPATGSPANQARLREIVQEAVKRAILEIIAPVVERSVTIATIATSALIRKDFARESDENRVRSSAQQMVRQLSGSLALVTCKEPLKMSMSNNIRIAIQAQDLPDQPFPEGAILMCVNDNLDTACNIVEKQAEDRSMPEIQSHIESEIAQRRQHRAEHPNENYTDPSFNRWAGYIPDPYKQASGGLNPEQMSIYLEFARQSRGPASHAQTGSADSGRQLPDVLQDAFASVPNVHTPAESLALTHQLSQQQQQSGRMLPPPIPSSIVSSQTNGYLDLRAIHERVQELLGEISRLVKDNPDRSTTDMHREGSVIELLNQAWDLIASSPDAVAMNCAEDICKGLFGDSMTRLEAEVFVQLLARLCQTYPNIKKEVAVWATSQDAQRMLNVDVTIPLLKNDIMQLRQIDESLTGLIYDREVTALEFLADLVDALLLNDHPTALRADLASSLGALGQWLADNPNLTTARDLVRRLKEWGVDEIAESRPDERGLIKKHQLQYLFAEWVAMCNTYPRNPNDNMFAAFVAQLQVKQLLDSHEEMAAFLRLCIEEATDSFRLETNNADGTSTEGFFKIDCLARLIVLLVRNQGGSNGVVKVNKSSYMDAILAIITVVMNHHHVTQGSIFDQRIYFRLLSVVLCDWHDLAREGYLQDRDMLLVFAENFLRMTPRYFPAFTYGWLMLISHRFFMPSILKLVNDEVSRGLSFNLSFADIEKGWEPYAQILDVALSYICQFLQSNTISPLSIDLYRAILRIILILHHDFPEFLAETHFRLCNAISRHCTQLHNLVLSAYPSSFPELPNPFVTGLKVDRLEEIRKAPRIVGDCTAPLVRANIKDTLDTMLKSSDISDDDIIQLANAAYISTDRGLAINSSLLHALVLYLGQSAIASAGQKGGQSFTSDSPQASIMTKMAGELHPEACYYFLGAMAHQLRYPNSHTHYFSHALLHLFGTNLADQQESDVRQQITRVLLERLHVIKPHPWGLVITMLELIKNPDYAFFQLPFIKASPVVRFSFPDSASIETYITSRFELCVRISCRRRKSGNAGVIN